MQLLLIQFKIKMFHIGFMQVLNDCSMRNSIKPMWNILIINCITNSCIWNAYVTWQGIDYKLPEDDKIVLKRAGVW